MGETLLWFVPLFLLVDFVCSMEKMMTVTVTTFDIIVFYSNHKTIEGMPFCFLHCLAFQWRVPILIIPLPGGQGGWVGAFDWNWKPGLENLPPN